MLKFKERKEQGCVKNQYKTIVSFVAIWIIVGIVLTFFAVNEIKGIFTYQEKVKGICYNYTREYDHMTDKNFFKVYYHYNVNDQEYTAVIEQAIKPINQEKTIFYNENNPQNYFIINIFNFTMSLISALFCFAAGIISFIIINKKIKDNK